MLDLEKNNNNDKSNKKCIFDMKAVCKIKMLEECNKNNEKLFNNSNNKVETNNTNETNFNNLNEYMKANPLTHSIFPKECNSSINNYSDLICFNWIKKHFIRNGLYFNKKALELLPLLIEESLNKEEKYDKNITDKLIVDNSSIGNITYYNITRINIMDEDIKNLTERVLNLKKY